MDQSIQQHFQHRPLSPKSSSVEIDAAALETDELKFSLINKKINKRKKIRIK